MLGLVDSVKQTRVYQEEKLAKKAFRWNFPRYQQQSDSTSPKFAKTPYPCNPHGQLVPIVNGVPAS